jgi:hypothetical protein
VFTAAVPLVILKGRTWPSIPTRLDVAPSVINVPAGIVTIFRSSLENRITDLSLANC